MSALWFLVLGATLAAACWAWAQRGLGGVNQVSIAATLAAAAAAFNVVVPVASVEATTTVVVVAALVLGAPFAMAVGVAAVLLSSLVGSIGPWTAWQVVATCAVAVLAGACAPLAARASRDVSWWSTTSARLLIGAITAVTVVTYDVVVTAATTASFVGGGSGSDAVLAALLLGVPFTVVHIAASVSLTVLAAPSLAQSLTRARERMRHQIT